MWNYRIIKKDNTYGLYEVIYNEDKEISAHSDIPEIESESVEDLIGSLEMMLEDARKSASNILEYENITFSSLYDERELGEAMTYEEFKKIIDNE
jgi:hypothetical protein